MMTPRELRDLRHLWSAKPTEGAFALFGIQAALSAMERRSGLGFTLPTATRRGLWDRLVAAEAAIGARESAPANQGSTDAQRAELAGKVARTLHKLADYHARKILPRVAALPPLPSAAELIGARAPGGAAVLPFPVSRRRVAPRPHDDDTPGAA